MSYTLKGRCDSRLCATLPALLAACLLAAALRTFWPFELVGLMLAVGLALDALLYSSIDYQPGWYALPFGLLDGSCRVQRATPRRAPVVSTGCAVWCCCSRSPRRWPTQRLRTASLAS